MRTRSGFALPSGSGGWVCRAPINNAPTHIPSDVVLGRFVVSFAASALAFGPETSHSTSLPLTTPLRAALWRAMLSRVQLFVDGRWIYVPVASKSRWIQSGIVRSCCTRAWPRS